MTRPILRKTMGTRVRLSAAVLQGRSNTRSRVRAAALVRPLVIRLTSHQPERARRTSATNADPRPRGPQCRVLFVRCNACHPMRAIGRSRAADIAAFPRRNGSWYARLPRFLLRETEANRAVIREPASAGFSVVTYFCLESREETAASAGADTFALPTSRKSREVGHPARPKEDDRTWGTRPPVCVHSRHLLSLQSRKAGGRTGVSARRASVVLCLGPNRSPFRGGADSRRGGKPRPIVGFVGYTPERRLKTFRIRTFATTIT
jgi:hypothetical protein